MQSRARFVGLLAILLITIGTAGCASATPPVRILFVGNSYTYYNDMPAIAKTLYEASGAGRMEVGMFVQAGQRLSDAAGPRLPELLRLMMGGRWDYVVLQEQSTLGGGFRNGRPVIGDSTAFHDAVRKLDREIRRTGAKTALLVTWANAAAPEQQAAITNAYEQIAREIDAIVIPAGPAWSEVLGHNPNIRLHQQDGSHPSERGSYLTACVVLTTLFHLDLSEAPSRLTVPDVFSPGRKGEQVIDIDPVVATILKEAAEATAQP